VLITSAGIIRLFCGRVARISGASSVTMLNIDELKLWLAKTTGWRMVAVLISGNVV